MFDRFLTTPLYFQVSSTIVAGFLVEGKLLQPISIHKNEGTLRGKAEFFVQCSLVQKTAPQLE